MGTLLQNWAGFGLLFFAIGLFAVLVIRELVMSRREHAAKQAQACLDHEHDRMLSDGT